MNPHDLSHLQPVKLAIRPLESGDRAGLSNLILALAKAFNPSGVGDGKPEKVAETLCAHYQDKAGCGYWVLYNTKSSEMLGGVGIMPRENVPVEEGVGDLRDLLLHPTLQGGGEGRKLVLHCLEAAAQMGYKQICLEPKIRPSYRQDSGVRFFRSGRTIRVTCITPG